MRVKRAGGCIYKLRQPGPQGHRVRKRSSFGSILGAAVAMWFVGANAQGCLVDTDNRCGPNQEYNGSECVCAEGFALVGRSCVACGENEVAADGECACVDGFSRPTADAACEEVPAGLGADCDTTSTPCTDATFDFCQPTEGTSGYCTNSECSNSDECSGAFACDTTLTPSVCTRPPTGQGESCQDNSDCTGFEASFCETLVTSQCIVEGCKEQAGACHGAWVCCDYEEFLQNSLCIPEEFLEQGACPLGGVLINEGGA